MAAEPAEKRKPLTKMQFAQLMLDQEGRWGCHVLPGLHPVYADFPVCGRKLSVSEGIIDEHLWPLAAGGGNELSNRSLFRKPCAKHKTKEFDAWLIAKVTRQGGGRGSQQIERERRKERTGSAGSIPTRPMMKTPGAKIQGGRRMETANRWPAKGTRTVPPHANPWGRT